jgi:hypothetical protein
MVVVIRGIRSWVLSSVADISPSQHKESASLGSQGFGICQAGDKGIEFRKFTTTFQGEWIAVKG